MKPVNPQSPRVGGRVSKFSLAFGLFGLSPIFLGARPCWGCRFMWLLVANLPSSYPTLPLTFTASHPSAPCLCLMRHLPALLGTFLRFQEGRLWQHELACLSGKSSSLQHSSSPPPSPLLPSSTKDKDQPWVCLLSLSGPAQGAKLRCPEVS
jgi:hypothetical protein